MPAPACYRHVTPEVEVTSDGGKKQFRRSEKSSTMLSELLGRAQLFSDAASPRGERGDNGSFFPLASGPLFHSLLFCLAAISLLH